MTQDICNDEGKIYLEIDPQEKNTIKPLEFDSNPKVVGWYRFGKSKTMVTKIGIYYKPNFIHRFFMKICLGLYWEND